VKTVSIILKWLFVLLLPLLLVSASIAGAVNCPALYHYGFEKYHVSHTTGLAETELEKAAAGLIGYFKSGEENISLTVIKDGKPFVLFNEREVAHLRDVKGLIRLDYWALLATFIYALAYTGLSLWRKNGRHLAWGLIAGSGLTLVLMLALGLGMLLNFDRLFLQFHLLSFANDLWLLDPSKDYLIMLFPGGFWYDATLFCAVATVVGAALFGGVGIGYLRFSRNRPY